MRKILLLAWIVAWTGCATDPKIRITGDASVTGTTIDHWQDTSRFRYGTIDDLGKVVLSLPQPPPSVRVIPGGPGVPGLPGTPGTPAAPPTPGTSSPGYNPSIYGQLLAFLQGGPGGNQLTLANMQQLSPSLYLLGQVYYANPGMTVNQLLLTPQAVAFLSAAQSILQPLGLWNFNTLNQWVGYVGPRLGTLLGILQSLYGQLSVPPPPGSPGTPGAPGSPGSPGSPGAQAIPDQFIVTAVNPYAVMTEIVKLFKGEDWLLFAEKSPRLVHSLTKHAGFSFPRLVLYGSRARLYAPSIVMTRRTDDDYKRTAYGLNQQGFFTNEQASGSGVFYQGPDDISLVYALVDIDGGRVKTLDAVASDRYALLKRATGGDIALLDRAATFSTGLLKADVAMGESHNYHIGVAAGTTPFTTMGGVTGGIEYGSGLFHGRVGLGLFSERSYDSDAENLIGYLETENELTTPSFTVVNKEKPSAPELNIWGSITLSAAGMTNYTLTNVQRGKKNIGRTFGGQGDVRLVPELHTSLDTTLFRFELYAGVTIAVVPYGRVDLDVPQQSLRPYPIRWHVGGAARLKLSNAIRFAELGRKKLSDDRRAAEELFIDRQSEWIFLSLSGVGEFSELFAKSRVTLSVDVADYSGGLVVETESYLDETFSDVRVGGSIKVQNFYARGLRSVKQDDYRVEAGFEFTF
jgi:hypothetical protein